ncbi:hypothetical protein [Gorillibacterium sp. CAU 1737]|uniref:hypothetical protein n=1 Tax=Gorillibacterium sp. CAU 1737 TaxID=3140362 RepID=UPI0032615E19
MWNRRPPQGMMASFIGEDRLRLQHAEDREGLGPLLNSLAGQVLAFCDGSIGGEESKTAEGVWRYNRSLLAILDSVLAIKEIGRMAAEKETPERPKGTEKPCGPQGESRNDGVRLACALLRLVDLELRVLIRPVEKNQEIERQLMGLLHRTGRLYLSFAREGSRLKGLKVLRGRVNRHPFLVPSYRHELEKAIIRLNALSLWTSGATKWGSPLTAPLVAEQAVIRKPRRSINSSE